MIRYGSVLRVPALQDVLCTSVRRNQTQSLRDILANLAATSSAKQESSKLAASVTTAPPKPIDLLKRLQGQSLNNQNAKNNKGKPGQQNTKPQGLNINWDQPSQQKSKLSVQTDIDTQFKTFGSVPGVSIRESMQRIGKQQQQQQQQTTQNVKGLGGITGGARPVNSKIVSKISDDFESRKANFTAIYNAKFGASMESYSAKLPLEIQDERHQRQLQNLKHKRQQFDEKMGLEPDWRTPQRNLNWKERDENGQMRGGEGRTWHRNINSNSSTSSGSMKEEVKEIDISSMKQELINKKLNQSNNATNDNNNSNNQNKKEKAKIREISLPDQGLTVRTLASRLSMKIPDLVQLLKDRDLLVIEKDMKVEDYFLDGDSAELFVLDLGNSVKRIEDKTAVRTASITNKPSTVHNTDENAVLLPRAPVVCVMGHVDHGKTTLLDTLRKYNQKSSITSSSGSSKEKNTSGPGEVAGTEAGGITQKLSAFGVEVTPGRNVMFLDTPGHAAFSSMRSHGAIATDLVILVVAIDDGVRPQTIEALKMAKEADCSIIVVLNKVDKIPYSEREAARSRVLTQLLKHDLIVEEFGGDVQVAEVAGRTGEGIDALMESLLLQAEVLELQASITGQAEAIVLDASVERGRGVVAEVLVRWGSLSVGDAVVVGGSYGKVKSMVNDRGEAVRTALPSHSVRLQGLRSLPSTGQEMLSVDSELVAKEIADRRQQELESRRVREQELQIRRAQMRARIEAEALAEAQGSGVAAVDTPKVVDPVKINVVMKADGIGTLEALKQIVNGIASRALQDVSVNIVGASVGDVSLSDVELAASGGDALVLAFNVGIVDSAARSKAKMLDVNICRNNVIYRLEDELVRTMLSHLPKERSLQTEGTAKVLKVYTFSGARAQVVAGLQVISGRLRTKASNSASDSTSGGYVYRITRNGKVVLPESRGDTELKRMKATVNEVENGLECGLTLSGYSDFQEGDEIECLKVLWTAPTEVVLPGTSGTLRESTQAGTTTATSTTTVAATATGSSGSSSSSSSNNSNSNSNTTSSSSSKKINQKM